MNQPLEPMSTAQSKSEMLNQAAQALADMAPITLVAIMQNLKGYFVQLFTWLAEQEVTRYCGPRRCRRPQPFQRWGTNPGSIVCGSERIKVRVPRIRNKKTNKEQPLQTYQALHQRDAGETEAVGRQLLLGLSQRQYKHAARQFATSFGLSASTVGRMFVKYTARWLEAFEKRTFESEEFVGLLIDGKSLRQQQMLVCVGLTREGKKRVLALAECKTEHTAAVRGMLQHLLARGFRHTERILVMVDGAKGIAKGVREVFGDAALIQRCQWHKRENVASKIRNKTVAAQVRTRMNQAYAAPTYAQAKQTLDTLVQDLQNQGHASAAASLREGMEETLTLHKLDVPAPLRDSLKTTNIIESVNSQIAYHTRNVKRWSNTNQRHRWLAASCVWIENQLNPIPNNTQWQQFVATLSREPNPVGSTSYLADTPEPALAN